MAIDTKQLASAIADVLVTAPRQLATKAAVQLLLGTAAQESNFGYYLEQVRGPARGIFQIEPATAQDLEQTLPPDLSAWLRSYRDSKSIPWALKYELDYQIACCRLKYFQVPQPLPAAYDVAGMAAYWKQFYNTPFGRGTLAEFAANYNKFVASR